MPTGDRKCTQVPALHPRVPQIPYPHPDPSRSLAMHKLQLPRKWGNRRRYFPRHPVLMGGSAQGIQTLALRSHRPAYAPPASQDVPQSFYVPITKRVSTPSFGCSSESSVYLYSAMHVVTISQDFLATTGRKSGCHPTLQTNFAVPTLQHHLQDIHNTLEGKPVKVW